MRTRSPPCLLAASLLVDKIRELGLCRDNMELKYLLSADLPCSMVLNTFLKASDGENGILNMVDNQPVHYANIFESVNHGKS